MELRILGTIEVIEEGRPLPLGGAKPRALLAALLAHRRSVVSLDRLTDVLWGDDPPPTARPTLQTHLSRVRGLLEPVGHLRHRPPGYLLEVTDEVVDADRFARELDRGRSLVAEDPQAAVGVLDAALALWRGPALTEFAALDWARAEAVRLDELRVVAHEERADAMLAAGEHASAVGALEAQVDAHPLRERPRCQLMVALHRSGRQPEALRAAEAFRRHLGDELGLEPSQRLVDLERAIATDALPDPPQVRERLGRVDGPAAPPVPHRSLHDLPASVTDLVGRSDDLDQLAEVLLDARLVTMNGPGGVGKSSLAIEVARRVRERFASGVRVVELAPVRDDAAVVAAFAQALDVERRLERSLLESMLDLLAGREMLIVVDNCEHVIDAVGRLVQDVLRWCPGVRLVTTSREPVGMAGEVVWPVTPLAVPDDPTAPLDVLAVTPAVAVFLARAREASPSFELTESTGPAVAALCTHLDGVPLALELGAARMASMTPDQLLARLDERFTLLGRGHGRDPRHRTLLDVVRWSYELLSPAEQSLFDRLSVFVGGFDLESAERVCASDDLEAEDVASAVVDLVDKSLVVADRSDGPLRYRQLETLREYGADRLAERPEAAAVRVAHRDAFVALAVRAGDDVEGPGEAGAGNRIERELGNLRAAALGAVADGDVDGALRLVTATREVSFRRIRYEAIAWAERAAAMDGADEHPLFPTALAVVGYGSFVRGEMERALTIAERAVEARTRLQVTSCALPERVLSNALFFLGDRAEALAWMEQMATAADATGIAGRQAHARYMCSVALTSVGDTDGGAELAARAHEAAQRAGSPTARSQADYAAALACGDVDASLGLLEASAGAAAAAGNRWMRAFAMTEAMWLRARRGETAPALRGYREVVEAWYRGGDWANQWLSIRQLAGTLALAGCDEPAAILFGAVDAAGASAALPLSPTAGDELADIARSLDDRIGADEAGRARRRGAGLRDDMAVRTALEAITSVVG